MPRLSARNGHNRGFTLMEILIVMAIIAVIGGTFLGNFFASISRARDSRRKQDLTEIQKSLELFKSDQDPPAYPPTDFMDADLCNGCWSQGVNCSGNIYMNEVPCDPSDKTPYYFTVDSNDDLKYTLTACLENSQDLDKDEVAVAQCSTRNKESYSLREP